jgi:hypothetical protein
MQVEQLRTASGQPINVPLLITPQVFGDDRGFFFESWNQRRFDDAGPRSLKLLFGLGFWHTTCGVGSGECFQHGEQPVPLRRFGGRGLQSARGPQWRPGESLAVLPFQPSGDTSCRRVRCRPCPNDSWNHQGFQGLQPNLNAAAA